jgi:uncharacterized protein
MERQRIELIDALRGLGVLGILTVNASLMAATFTQAFVPPLWPFPNTGLSLGIWTFVQIFCDSKFITLFSMLFGVSMYLVGGEPGTGRTINLWRRFGWLAVFGLIHGMLIWYGDVLLDYAVCGLVVMALRGWSGRKLLMTGIIAFAAGVAAMQGASAFIDAHPDIYAAITPGHAAKVPEFQGSFAQSLWANIATWAHYRAYIAIFTIPYAAPLMLIGLGLFKTGFLTGMARKWVYAAAIGAAALALGIYGWLVEAYVASGFGDAYGDKIELGINLSSPFISLGYASVLILASQTRLLGWIAKLLAPLGRMAFTNYIAQSVMMTIVFYGGRGLNLFDRLDRPQIALVVLAVWSIELVWSHLWLRRFDAGPLEWGWRCLTYNRIGPIRRGSAPS